MRAGCSKWAPSPATARLRSRSPCRGTAASSPATSTKRRRASPGAIGPRPEWRTRSSCASGRLVDTLEALLADGGGETFDFAFIDADKVNYDAYYEGALALLRQGGLMVIDNVLWSGAVADPERQDADTTALRALNAKLHDDQRISLSLLPVSDGITLARKR